MRKKSIHRPSRKTNPLAMYTTLGGSRQFDAEERVALILPVRLSLDAFFNQNYTEDDVLNLCTATNVGLKLTETNDALHSVCLKTQAILSDAYTKLSQNGTHLSLELSQKTEVLTAVEIYETIIGQVTPKNLLNILEEVKLLIYNSP